MEARQAERAALAAQEQAKLDEALAMKAKLQHVSAEVGEKVTLTGVVTMATTLQGHYGAQRLITIQTEDYQVAKMITTADWAWSVDFHDVITVAAVVKSQDEYQGTPQTTLVRPKQVQKVDA